MPYCTGTEPRRFDDVVNGRQRLQRLAEKLEGNASAAELKDVIRLVTAFNPMWYRE